MRGSGSGLANAKPKYPPEASGGYNNQLQQSTYLYDKRNRFQIWQFNKLWQRAMVKGHSMTMYTYTRQLLSLSTSYIFVRYNLQILNFKVTMAQSKVKSRSHYDGVYLQAKSMSIERINFLHLTDGTI